MTDNSLLLLAVRRALNLGTTSVQGTKFAQFYGLSSLESANLSPEDIPPYLEILKEDFIQDITESIKQQALSSIETSNIFSSTEILEDETMFINTLYDLVHGKMLLHCYNFQPCPFDGTILAETLTISFKFRLADNAILITKSKGSASRAKWSEVRYIKPAVTFNDFVNALAFTIAPILQFDKLGIQTPAGLQNKLITMAKGIPSSLPSDDKRRTVYNPMTKTSSVVMDEALLKRMPGRWEYVTSKQVEAQMLAETMNANELYSQWAYED